MKEFLKYTAATVVGIIIFGTLLTAFGLMSVVGIMASDQATTTIDDNSVMVLTLNGPIYDQGRDDIIGRITGDDTSTTGLNDMLAAIKKAKIAVQELDYAAH